MFGYWDEQDQENSMHQKDVDWKKMEITSSVTMSRQHYVIVGAQNLDNASDAVVGTLKGYEIAAF